MEDDEISYIDVAPDSAPTSYERQLKTLNTYLDSLPYECETVEQMQTVLEGIIGKMYIAVEAKNWSLFTSWDGMLQCWLAMYYPIPTSTRAKLIRVYYELCVLPGIDPRSVRNWSDTLSRLIGSKYAGLRKVDPADLQLPWQPLWQAIRKELWPKSPSSDSSRNLVNILFFAVEKSKRYFPPEAVPEMLEAFLPELTQDTLLTMIPVLTSFLPLTNSGLYLPALFKIWEGFNSSIVDDRMLELCGELAEEHVAGVAGQAGQYAAEWKDIGIWTQWQWDLLTGKCLSSTNMPIGLMGSSATSTSSVADSNSKQRVKIKKTTSRLVSMAKIFIYSISQDGEVRDTTADPSKQTGLLAGSKALDTLDKLINSAENYFHPSNNGPWTTSLTAFIQRLCAEFIARWNSQALSTCTVPESQRLTPQIKRAFVSLLRTPALLSMFAKDAGAASFAQGALRTLALLEPNLIMPELLDRAYGGLEVVNETHRTTGVLSTLSGVTRPLVTESIWLGGQKHLVPLLELCLPGIDLNDPTKTIYATMFIVGAVQHVKLGDLSAHQGGVAFTGDSAEDRMDVDEGVDRMPEDLGDETILDRDEERSLTRDSTSGFADWVVSLFRRVFALYENLPEEGGKRQVTGGKSEEAVLKSIKNMLDVVCLHLSEPLFDLVLKLVFDYATTNAKSNSVRAFGQLVASLAKVNAEKTVTKFMTFCAAQIEDELKHGASSVRTTSSHAAVPSDTTLHWNLSILRGCLGYGGKTLVKYKDEIIHLISILIEKTKSERGYTSTGRLITRVLNTLSGIYPLQGRYVNPSVWEDPAFDRSHNLSWGKLMEASEVDIEWHVPSAEEVDFILEVLEKIGDRKLNDIEELLGTTAKWDNVARNDFCRYLHAVRSVWIGLPTIYKTQPVTRPNNMLMPEFESPAMIVSTLDMNCGFVLSNPDDPRYKKVVAHRERFGQVVKRAASLLRQGNGGEDHTDAVITVTRCIDTYLSSYGLTHGEYEALKKNYTAARELNRSWIRQKDNARLIWIKRAHVYHMSRVHMHSMFRGRLQLDDDLLMELAELSLSQYTRIRRQAQATLITATMRYVRSTRLILPTLFNALARGNDPDRMKGALYVLAHKGIAAYTIQDLEHQKTYLLSLLESQHEDKPSIQKLVTQVVNDAGLVLGEENINTHVYHLGIPRVLEALSALPSEFSGHFIDQVVCQEIATKTLAKASKRQEIWTETISSILDIAARPTTHWRYTQMALQLLCNLLWRDVPATPEFARFIALQSTSPQQVIRSYAYRAMGTLLYHVKIRTYCRTREARWSEDWTSPWKLEVDVNDPAALLAEWQKPIQESSNKFYIDELSTGFLAWTKTIKVYRLPEEVPPVEWDQGSKAALEAIQTVITEDDYINRLVALWSQESGKNSDLQLRMDNVVYMKLLAKVFGDRVLDSILDAVDPLILDADKFKQRAAGELILALLRGSKNWPPNSAEKLWSWLKARIDRIFAQIRPDTLAFWEQVFHSQLASRDPRRNQVLVDWIKSIPQEFSRFSAFDSMKSMSMVGTLLATTQAMPRDEANGYIGRYFKDADTGYAELRQYICNHLYLIMRNQWRPWHKSTREFLAACTESDDALHIRQAIYMDHISAIISQLPQWREERLPPPRVNQSQYDKVGLTVLQWIWVSSYGAPAHLVIPYIVPLLPEILRMSELSDNPDLQAYSSGVLYVLSALTPLSDYVNPILDQFVISIESSTSWRTRLHGLPAVAIFFFRNLLTLSQPQIDRVLSLLLDCLSNENVEVREVASKVLSSVVRTSQRQSILPLKKRFVTLARKTTVPGRSSPEYAARLRTLHSAVLGICALIESFPYSVESWMPPLTEVLARHASDPPPISTTIRKTASEFKKTHQDTWHKDQHMFDEDQLQSLSTMLVGTSYYA